MACPYRYAPDQPLCVRCFGDGVIRHEAGYARDHYYTYCDCPIGQTMQQDEAEQRLVEMFRDQQPHEQDS